MSNVEFEKKVTIWFGYEIVDKLRQLYPNGNVVDELDAYVGGLLEPPERKWGIPEGSPILGKCAKLFKN